MPIPGLELIDGQLLDGLTFCSIAYDILEAIQSEPGGLEDLRLLRTPRAKRMVEEVLPIAAFIQSRYGPGLRMRVRWRGGNQGYDAILRCAGLKAERLRLPPVQHLEVTTAVHPNEYLVREHLHREGISFGPTGTTRDPRTRKTVSNPTVTVNDEPQRELVERVRSRIASKAQMTYPRDTSLIVRCVINAPVLDDEWEHVVRLLREGHCPARFLEVVLVEPVAVRVTALFVRRRKHRRSNIGLQPTAAGRIMSRRG